MRIADARALSGVLVLLAAVVLSGCASTPEPAPTSAVPTFAPVFATEEEALAAATEAYAAYLAVSDEVSNSGGENAERYESVASGTALENAFVSADQFRSAGAHSVGSSSFTVDSVQDVVQDGNSVRVTIYVCDDVGGVEVLGPTGLSIVEPDRPDRAPFQVTLVLQPNDGASSLDEKSIWTGANFC